VKNFYRTLGVVLLVAIAIHRYATAHAPASVEQYHQSIRTAAEGLPRQISGWVGEDVPVPVQAVTLLRPNVMLSRRYVNVENGASAGVLFVHCSDAHSMAGHYPLRCYPARGWNVRSAEPRDWLVGNLLITGTEYEFTQEEFGAPNGERSIVVANCLLRPDGQILRDMDGMTKSIVGAGGQSTGAGQIQIYFDSHVPKSQRDATIAALINGYKPLLNAVLANPVK
jgi:hypothetical protein